MTKRSPFMYFKTSPEIIRLAVMMLASEGGYAGVPNEFRSAVTPNLNISFVAAPNGRFLIEEWWRIGGGKTIYCSEGHLEDDTGPFLARAIDTFRLLSPVPGKSLPDRARRHGLPSVYSDP